MNDMKKSEDISGEEYKPLSDTKAYIWVLFKKIRDGFSSESWQDS